MIQDITPHIYNNHYEKQRAQAGDYCVCIYDEKLLMEKIQGQWKLPVFSELAEMITDEEREASVYLFSIDEKKYFLCSREAAEKVCGAINAEDMTGYADDLQTDPFGWKNRRDMRSVMPRVTAFAGITALQIEGWYRSNVYCGRCGKKLQHDHKERMMRCPKCQNMIYPRINPAAIIGITDGDKILMTKYARGTYSRYALVAGFNEIGESIEDTVSREVMEETGLKVKNIRFYKSQPWSFSDTLLMGFFCELDGDNSIVLDHEELSVGEWISRGRIDQVQESYDDLSLTNEMILYFRDHKECF